MRKKLIAPVFACLMLVIIIFASNSANARISMSQPCLSNTSTQMGTLMVVVDSNIHPIATVTAYKITNPSHIYNIPWNPIAKAYISDLPVGVYTVTVRLGLIILEQSAVVSTFSIITRLFFEI